jgi:hypothetical protein
MNGISDLLEFLKYILGCTYISDLKTKNYNVKAKDLPKHEYHRGNSNIDDWRKVR